MTRTWFILQLQLDGNFYEIGFSTKLIGGGFGLLLRKSCHDFSGACLIARIFDNFGQKSRNSNINIVLYQDLYVNREECPILRTSSHRIYSKLTSKIINHLKNQPARSVQAMDFNEVEINVHVQCASNNNNWTISLHNSAINIWIIFFVYVEIRKIGKKN